MSNKLETYTQRLGSDTSGVRPVMIPDENGQWVDRHDAEHLVEMLQQRLEQSLSVKINISSALNQSNQDKEELQNTVDGLRLALSVSAESLANAHHVLREETARSNALAAENAMLKETLEQIINSDNEPENHEQGMGCGVEDRGYQRDGYAACHYGWEQAMERVYSEVIPDSVPATPVTDVAIAAIEARGVNKFASELNAAHLLSRKGSARSETLRGIAMRALSFADRLRKGIKL